MPVSELIRKNAIIREGSFRKKAYDRAVLEFCSLLGINMAYMQVQGGGSFLGNGWESCNLFGLALRDVTVEMDRFRRCSMGSTDFRGVRLEDVRFCGCSFAGSVWTGTVVEGGVFQDCSFRGMRLQKVRFRKTVFQKCVLDDCCLEAVTMEMVRFQGCTIRDVKGMPEQGVRFL